jgi:alkylation response protein AidB-like acyl-CoA dehydrogenase
VLAVLTEEHRLVADTALRLGDAFGVKQPADLESVDRVKAWAALADTGFLGLRVRDGGVPLASGVEVALVAEALANGMTPIPFLSAVLAVELLELAGADEELIGGIAAGDVRCALALTSDLRSLGDPAAGGVLLDVDDATLVLGLVEQDGAARVVQVPVTAAPTSLSGADLTRSLGVADLVGAVEVGGLSAEAADRWLALALTALAADACGVARAALMNAVEYTKERVQYGVKIGTFQALQHLCADALVEIEAAVSAVRYASWCIDEVDPAEALLAARVAKAKASSMVLGAAETAMQVCGGVGQTEEHIAHVHLRRGLLDRQLLGDSDHQLLQIADARLGGR